MTLSTNFIVNKLETLMGYEKEMSVLLLSPDGELLDPSKKLHVVERVFQLMVDVMIDINQHLIKELNLELPDDLLGTFIMIGNGEILPKEFALKIAPVTGVRNLLVHGYEKLDKPLFINNLRKNFGDFKEYREHILKYIKSVEVK